MVINFLYAISFFGSALLLENISSSITSLLDNISFLLGGILFLKINIPFFVLWLIAAGLFFAYKLDFVPFRLFGHAVKILRGNFDKKEDIGLISHKEAIFVTSLGTVGLASLSGVAISIVVGGPGAIFWTAIISIICIPIKFSEAILGHKFRNIDLNTGEISGGAFDYIRKGMKSIGRPRLGNALSIFYAIALIGASISPANMFQTNQTIAIIVDTFPKMNNYIPQMSILIVGIISFATFGGIRLIGKLSLIIVPLMLVSYIAMSIIVVLTNAHAMKDSLRLIFNEAFASQSIFGGIVGAITAGAVRVIYTTESGGGTTALVHATVKTSEPVQEGLTAVIEILMPIVMALLTGLMVVLTDSASNKSTKDGILILKNAFSSVSPSFAICITIMVPFLAITTVMAWNYYGQVAWKKLFGKKIGSKTISIFNVIFLLSSYYGCTSTAGESIVRFSDYVWSSASIPNIIALYALSGVVKKDIKIYLEKFDLLNANKNKIQKTKKKNTKHILH